MKGKTVVVTGATNGIGEAIAEDIAKMGAKTIIVGRSKEKCLATIERIRKKIHHNDIHYYLADLSVQNEVRQLASKLNQELDRLDVLVNNAGAWFAERKESVDGYEKTWALNHLAYFLLTEELMPLLQQTAKEHGEARIINQASMAHSEGLINWEDLQFETTWDSKGQGSTGAGWGVYAQSKLANVIHAFTLARRLEGTAVVANAVHPGVVVTGFSQNNGFIYRFAAPIRRLFNRSSIYDGAAPAVYLATAPEAAKISGTYYGPPKSPEEPNPVVADIEIQERLWTLSAEQVGLIPH